MSLGVRISFQGVVVPGPRLETGAMSLNKNRNDGRAEFFAPPVRGLILAAVDRYPAILCSYPKLSAPNSEREFVYCQGIGF